MPAATVEPGSYADQTDEWLVARCRDDNDDRAFSELVDRYRTRVFRLAISILGQEFAPEAEDVAQEVMLRVHRSLASFRGESKFGSWIYRITFNQSLNVKARARFRTSHVGEDALVSTASTDKAADERLQDARRNRATLECVAELPEVYQSSLRLHYWLGASMAEIAEMLDANENTVKSYLHRARQLLRAMLAERGFDAR